MRTKEQYIEGLRKMRRNIYVDGNLIDRDDEMQMDCINTIGMTFDRFFYDNIDWGNDDNQRFISESVYPDYSQPASGDNYIYNHGADNAMIDFFLDDDAYLIGAHFAKGSQNYLPYSAEKVRFVGLDNQEQRIQESGWLILTNTPQFLSANFDPVYRIVVERDAGDVGKYTMDDLQYDIVPEPASLSLIALGAIVFSTRKKKYFDRFRRR